jgi:hypothetical protein
VVQIFPEGGRGRRIGDGDGGPPRSSLAALFARPFVSLDNLVSAVRVGIEWLYPRLPNRALYSVFKERAMAQLIPLILILPLLAFYIWMFRDMTHNDALSPDVKQNWMWMFILFNVFAAAFYYVREYRNR